MQMKKFKELTQAEEQIMQVLWQKNQAFVKDILDSLEEPKPAYTTVSTIIRILESKGFAGHESYGKTHRYYPLISKNEYAQKCMKKFIGNYFSQSFHHMVSFFTQSESLSLQELEEIKQIMEREIEKKKEQEQ